MRAGNPPAYDGKWLLLAKFWLKINIRDGKTFLSPILYSAETPDSNLDSGEMLVYQHPDHKEALLYAYNFLHRGVTMVAWGLKGDRPSSMPRAVLFRNEWYIVDPDDKVELIGRRDIKTSKVNYICVRVYEPSLARHTDLVIENTN